MDMRQIRSDAFGDSPMIPTRAVITSTTLQDLEKIGDERYGRKVPPSYDENHQNHQKM